MLLVVAGDKNPTGIALARQLQDFVVLPGICAIDHVHDVIGIGGAFFQMPKLAPDIG